MPKNIPRTGKRLRPKTATIGDSLERWADPYYAEPRTSAPPSDIVGSRGASGPGFNHHTHIDRATTVHAKRALEEPCLPRARGVVLGDSRVVL